jgi:hypothetical protein
LRGRYGIIAPGLVLAYPGCYVSINAVVNTQPTLAIGTSGLNASVPVALEFLVAANNGSTVSAFTIDSDTAMSATLSIGPDSTGALALMGQLEYLSAALTLASSNVGSVNTGLLQK